jgi:hypothetical protein
MICPKKKLTQPEKILQQTIMGQLCLGPCSDSSSVLGGLALTKIK